MSPSTESAPTPSSKTCCCIRAREAASSDPPTTRLRCRCRLGRTASTRDYACLPQSNLEQLLCSDQAQNASRRTSPSPRRTWEAQWKFAFATTAIASRPLRRKRCSNPFFTTKPAGEGTGLGLSMTHDIIVKQHGGRIDVETEPRRFTEIIITLPRTPILQKTPVGTN
jgi:hypothetical protein